MSVTRYITGHVTVSVTRPSPNRTRTEPDRSIHNNSAGRLFIMALGYVTRGRQRDAMMALRA